MNKFLGNSCKNTHDFDINQNELDIYNPSIILIMKTIYSIQGGRALSAQRRLVNHEKQGI